MLQLINSILNVIFMAPIFAIMKLAGYHWYDPESMIVLLCVIGIAFVNYKTGRKDDSEI